MIEFLSDGGDLSQLELDEAQAAPAVGGADQRAEHELECGLRAEAVGNDLEPLALLDEQPLEEIRRPDEAAMSDRQSQVGDAEKLKSDPSALAAWVKEPPGQNETLLVIDQAEELITMNRDDAATRSFLTLIDRALAEGGDRLRVVLTVRSEFEPQFAQSPLKERWKTARSRVSPMTQDELRRVIEEPAAVKVMRFEPAELVDRLARARLV